MFFWNNQMKTITLSEYELQEMLTEAAAAGANRVFEGLMIYNKQEAAKLLRMSYITLPDSFYDQAGLA